MFRIIVWYALGGMLRRMLLPTLMTLAGGYWLFGPAIVDVVFRRSREAVAAVSGWYEGWSEQGKRREFDVSQRRFSQFLLERRRVGEQVEAIRRNRDRLAHELAEMNQVFRTVRPASASSEDDFDGASSVEIDLRRQRALRFKLREADRMLETLTDAFARMSDGAVDAWTTLQGRALDLQRRGAWRSGTEAFEKGRRLLEELPGSPAREPAVDDFNVALE